MEKNKSDTPLVIPVDAERLSQSLKTVFLGVAGVFDSLAIPAGQAAEAERRASETIRRMTGSTAKSSTPATATVEEGGFPDICASDAPPWESETAGTAQEQEANSQTQPAPAQSLTIDDITRTVAKKIEANRKNTAKIGQLVKAYGLESLKQLPPEKFEAFMTDLAQI